MIDDAAQTITVHFWPQSINDLGYLQSLGAADGVRSSLAGFGVLDRGVDYVGTACAGASLYKASGAYISGHRPPCAGDGEGLLLPLWA